MPKKILFVCTGNTCRSVMAEGIAKQISSDFEFSSSGILANPSYRIYGALEEIFAEERIPYDDHVSTPLTKRMIEESDAVFVMEKFHRDFIAERFPEHLGKVFLLTEFAGEKGDVPDPIGRPKADYRKTFDRIKSLVKKVIEKLKADNGIRED
ncbi:MAG: low molecular weight protein arginine phosphatase [Elusimicrobia bacterium]|nr:low molecular weight protein arginine phosphatase [Elusimicrobiota bacterium]